MAQKSKKQQIADAAIGLFLEQGFKGTSVDMVVKASGASKPTVYNHFPDKAALFDYIVEQWRCTQPEHHSPATLDAWLSGENLALMRLAIGEGFRFPNARAQLFDYLDTAIRAPLRAQGGTEAVTAFDSQLLQKLMQ